VVAKIALDATYSVGTHLSGVGHYSREMLFGLAAAHPDASFRFCYRPHRFLKSFRDKLPSNARRAMLQEPLPAPRSHVFHGLNQRLPELRLGPAVTTFHDLFVLTEEYSTADFRARFAAQARDAAARSHLIIAVSAFTAQQVQDLLSVDPSRLRVIHHGVRTPKSIPVAREKLILHVGALQARKNISRLVKAFEAVDAQWKLVLAGSTGYGGGKILEQIEASPCRSRIVLAGYVDDNALDGWYARAQVLAFASLDEGFGMPILEGMAHGLAVMTSNRSALPEVAGDAALLVDPTRTDEISSALERLTTEEDLRRDLADRGRRRASRFTWREAVEKTWQVYRELGAV
jgi:glycosyltransferase involved in cell wall biosynthesis